MKKYKISEIAKLFNISRQTLIYYNKIGLLKPETIDPNNGYRYYSSFKILELSFILFLKEAGFSLKDIMEYTKINNINEGKEFLIKKEIDLEKKINLLQTAQKKIQDKIKMIDKLKTKNNYTPKIEKIPKYYFLNINLNDYESEYRTDVAYIETEILAKKYNLDEYQTLTSINLDSALKKNYFDYIKLGLVSFEKKDSFKKMNSILCATLIHKGDFLKIGEAYEKLFDFIKNSSYEIIDNPIEFNNNSVVFLGDGIGSIVKIAIPILDKKKPV